MDTSRRVHRSRTYQSPLDDDYACYSFACIDPDAACVNDDDITVDMFENCGYVLGIGNGYCDENNNTEECGRFPFPVQNTT